jgi:hypothetical protein
MYDDLDDPDTSIPGYDGGGRSSAPWSSWNPFDFGASIKALFCIPE